MKKILTTILFLTLLSSCTSKDGRYVYIDNYNCIHVKSSCKEFSGFSKDKLPMYSVRFAKPNDINIKKSYYGYRFCANCVSTDDYELLQKEMKAAGLEVDMNNI